MSESSEAFSQRRARFIQKAAVAYDRMCGPDEQSDLVTFDQREQRACELTDELARLLLEEQLASDPAVQAGDGPCPQCGRPMSSQGSEPRQVQTRRGAIQFDRAKGACPTCRRNFFCSTND